MLVDYLKTNGIAQYNSIIQNKFPDHLFFPSILKMPDVNRKWGLSLPDTKSNVVLHAQDYLNVLDDDTISEFAEIEGRFIDQEVILVHWNHNIKDIYNGRLKLIEFPTHSFEFVQRLKNSYSDWKTVNGKLNTKNFMCLSGNIKPHRKLVYDYLIGRDNSIVTLFDNSSYNVPYYKDYDFDNVANFIKLIDIYQMCPVNVVTETLYYTSHGIITEKTLDAFASLQLPIVIGYKGIVDDIRNYGFDMFDDIIDHSYDNIPNETRWKSAIDLNAHILEGKFNYNELMPRLIKNQEYLLNGYLDNIIVKFDNQAKALQGTN